MKLAWHIIAKDLRRHQLPYGLWLCLLFAKQGALALGFSDWSADAEWFDRLQMGSMVLSVVEGAVAFLLVGSWVMEDPLVGSTQFWVTRPIAGRRLLAAKLLGVVLGFVVVPLLIAMTGWIVCGLSGLELGRQFVWSGTLQLALVAAAFVLAAVSDRGNRFLVVLLGSVVVLVALGPVVAKLFTVYPETRALALTRATVGSCLIVAAVITAVWLQFTRRNVLLGAACLLSGVVAGVSACNQFPVELFGGWQTTPRELPEARNVELVLSHMQPTQPPSSVKIPQGQRWIQVVCTVRNLPEHLRLRVTSFGRFSFIAADGRRHDVERSFLAATIPDNDTYDARAAAGIRPYVFDDDAETKAEIGQRIEER